MGTLAVLSVSLLVIGLDNTILNVALPSLARSLDATSGQLQWMVDGVEQLGELAVTVPDQPPFPAPAGSCRVSVPQGSAWLRCPCC